MPFSFVRDYLKPRHVRGFLLLFVNLPAPNRAASLLRLLACASYRYDVIAGRIHYPVYLRCQCIEGVLHFPLVRVPIVNAAHAGDGVAEAALGDVGVDASARHQAARCPSQIMQRPILHAASEVELELECRESANRVPSIGRERELAALDLRYLSQHLLGRARERQRHLGARLIAGGRDAPLITGYFAPRHRRGLSAPGGRQQEEANELPPWAGIALGRRP